MSDPENNVILEKKLMPTYMAAHFYEIDADFCRDNGIRALICDIDNTLATYDDVTMPDVTETWLSALREAGIGVAFVSNNTSERVETFIGESGVFGYPDAHKPSPKYLHIALAALDCGKENAAFLGDQLLTDALAASRAGLRAIIVPPICDRTGAFFRFKRRLERPYIRKFLKRPNAPKLDGTVWE